MNKIYLFFLVFLYPLAAFTQELFLHTEPASNIPKGVLSARLFGESYQEEGLTRGMGALRLSYGLSSNWTIWVQPGFSNHHGAWLSEDFLDHYHVGNSTIFFTSNKKYGDNYPYRFGGIHFYSKYRVFTRDEKNKHTRIALYGEFSTIKTAHDEAEPNLREDNGGYGGGFIVTNLNKKLAISLTAGLIFPNNYYEKRPSGDIELQYGRGLNYSLSFGYLIYPKEYKSYNQDNYNVYVEFLGKAYEGAKVFQSGEQVNASSPALQSGHYIEMHPGVQRIINSNTRIDFSVGLPIVNRSYARFYPLYMIGIQRYFYP